MTRAYSGVQYYKDIDTLEELDASGLPIGTMSGSIGPIFKESFGSEVISSLNAKYKIMSNASDWTITRSSNITDWTIGRTAHARDICSVERLTDVGLIIAVNLK